MEDRRKGENGHMKKQTEDGFTRSIVNLLRQEGLLSTEETVRLLSIIRRSEG